jgi:hypothetical protein
MLELPDVTLGCVDTREPAMALWAMRRTMSGIRFGDAVLFTDSSRLSAAPDGIRLVDVRVETIEAYSQFMLRGLSEHVGTSHLLVVQWDGFATRPQRWQPDFLEWDYIGARWHDKPTERSVGNGGFSLRSRRLLHALLDPAIDISHPEDICICLHNRERLERQHGIRIAPPAAADRFAYERLTPMQATFGFHGLFNFPRELTANELREVLTALPDRQARGLDAHDLCASLIADGALHDAQLLLDKRRRLGMHDRRSLRLAWRMRVARWRQRLKGEHAEHPQRR